MRSISCLLLCKLAIACCLLSCSCSDNPSGCLVDTDCPGVQICDQGNCVNNDCPGVCPIGKYCSGNGCVACQDDWHCGDRCINCRGAANNKVCRNGACGCNTAKDCGPGESCVEGNCQNLALCGNGQIDPGETCGEPDLPACPTICDDADPCTSGSMTGSADACNVACKQTAIVACQNGDSCCPAGCNFTNDSDCSLTCGNGTVDPGETCENCPKDFGTCPPACPDGTCNGAENCATCPEDCGSCCGNATCGRAYYVSPSGHDNNPGSQAEPWKTIQKAADTMVAGDTVLIADGTYNEKVTPQNSGSAADGYISYRPDNTNASPVLEGNGIDLDENNGDQQDGLFNIIGKSYIKLDGLTIQHASVNAVNIAWSPSKVRPTYIEVSNLKIYNSYRQAIFVKASDTITIRNNLIDHVDYSSGIGIWRSTYATVDGNTISNAHYYHECQGAHEEVITIASVGNFEVMNNTIFNTEAWPWIDQPYPSGSSCDTNQEWYDEKLGIDVKESSYSGYVHHNLVKDMTAAAIYVDGWLAGSDASHMPTLNNIDIYQNRTEGSGILIGCEQSTGIVEFIRIYENLVINARFSGILVKDGWGDGLRENIYIYNNTVYGANFDGGYGGAGIYVTTSHLGTNNGDRPIVIKNNISTFYFMTGETGWLGQIIAKDATIEGMITASNNIRRSGTFNDSDANYCSSEYPDCQDLAGSDYGGIQAERSDLYVNPVLPTDINLNLRLMITSPAIDAGETLESPYDIDYDGVSRPQGSAYDIGAYEYKSGGK